MDIEQVTEIPKKYTTKTEEVPYKRTRAKGIYQYESLIREFLHTNWAYGEIEYDMELHHYTKIISGINKVIRAKNLTNVSVKSRGSRVFLVNKKFVDDKAYAVDMRDIDDMFYDFAANDELESYDVTLTEGAGSDDLYRFHQKLCNRRSVLRLDRWIKISYKEGIITLSKDLLD